MELPQAGYGDQLSGERVQLNNEVRPTDQDTFHGLPARLVLDPQLEEEHRELLHGRRQQEGAGLRDLTEMEDRYDCSYGWTMIFQCIMTSWMIIPARAHIKRYLATSKHSFETCALAIQLRGIEKETLRSCIPDIRFDINGMSERDCIDRFRFGKTHLAILLWKFQLPTFFSTEEGYRTSGIEGLCVVLERLSSTFYYVCEHIARRCAPLRDGDWTRISSRLDEYTSAVRVNRGELRNVWGFIDGTIRRIGKPLGNAEQHALYSGHKRCHGIKFQSVTTPDGIISHLFGPAEGRLHDLTLLDASGLEETIQNDQRFDGYLLYGDPAYGHTDVFASPFDRIGATREESEVNASMSRVRITVEWGFGQVIDE
ncbi:hypothetical protein F442_06545 [Phytophthora nicotianae P10297]|uniref:DDE Tnp4 domain-containing protein n=1 Tax=Phytophthora nicotianae P10297 TaxID=1317064 RepID=W2ZJ78_PHYNI|nr:hypothetical protein F442_06545 [Phytophthora nicotianae P10297]